MGRLLSTQPDIDKVNTVYKLKATFAWLAIGEILNKH